MIDTDKYEGHIAGPWVYEEDNPHNLRGAWEATVLIPAPYNDTKEYPNGRPHPVLSAAYDLYHLDSDYYDAQLEPACSGGQCTLTP